MAEPRSFRSLFRHLSRAMRLRCPACGRAPLFTPWYRVRSLREWFAPLDGCPYCGYPYEREIGYYLLATWAVNYGAGSVTGITIYLILEWLFDLPLNQLLMAVIFPILFFNILFARHAKAIFLAVDLFFDPHERDGGDDRGNFPDEPPPFQPAPKEEPCREPAVMR